MKINLKKLKEVGEKATEGPWVNSGTYGDIRRPLDENGRSPYVLFLEAGGWWENSSDAAFSVLARNHWTQMIEALEEANKALEEATCMAGNALDDDSQVFLERFEDEA